MPLRALLYRRPTEPQAIEVLFDGSVFLVRLRRHRQARRYTLRIQAASREAILTIPPRGSLKEAKSFAEKNGGWIAARLGRLAEAAPFESGTVVPLRGQSHRIEHRSKLRGTVWTETNWRGQKLICAAGDAPHIRRRVADFLKREARRDLEVACRHYATMINVNYKRIVIRDQASRWGSCSTTGVLSFSWRLILTPPYVLDYLAAHEVAHLAEMNHSRRFWRLVERMYPNWHRAKTWLEVHGTDLHRYGEEKRKPAGRGARAAARAS
jgi:predicted metal-dependent hydrolase